MKKLLFCLLIVSGQRAFGMLATPKLSFKPTVEYVEFRNKISKDVLPHVESVEKAIVAKLKEYKALAQVGSFLSCGLRTEIIPWVVSQVDSKEGVALVNKYLINIKDVCFSSECNSLVMLGYFISCDTRDAFSLWNCAIV